MDSFVCPTCGDSHDGTPTDHAWKLPDVVWAIPEKQRARKAKFTSDLCRFDRRFFIRCLLKLPFNERPGYYGWGVWVEVDKSGFRRYSELYDEDGREEPPIAGLIANKMPGYHSTLKLPVMVQFQDITSRPSVYLPVSDHLLAREQSAGIDNRRYHEILVVTGSIGEP